MNVRCRVKWEPRDLWIGVYWNAGRNHWARYLDVYVCVLPMLPLHIRFRWWLQTRQFRILDSPADVFRRVTGREVEEDDDV